MNAGHAFPALQSKGYVDHARYVRNAADNRAQIDICGVGIAKGVFSRTIEHRGQGQPWRIACRSSDLAAPGKMQAPLQGAQC